MKWLYPTENTDFATVSNWGWVTTSDETIDSAPGELDTAKFIGLDTADGTASRTVTLSADTSVSNFIYQVGKSSGTLTFNLATYTLTVLGCMNLETERSYLNTDTLVFKDGTVAVTGTGRGTFVGGGTSGNKNADWGGFYVNIPAYNNRGCNLTLDNAKLNISGSAQLTFLATGIENGSYVRTNFVKLVNGAEINGHGFNVGVLPLNCPTAVDIEVKDSSKMTIYDSAYASEQYNNVLKFDGSDKLTVAFRDNSTLKVGLLIATGSKTSLLFTGGEHSLLGALNWADDGSMRVAAATVTVSDTAKVTVNTNTKLAGGATMNVCDGGQMIMPGGLSVGANFYAVSMLSNNTAPTNTVVVDDGELSAASMGFGAFVAAKDASDKDITCCYSNNCLRVVGPLSRVATTGENASGAISFNYGARVEFEIPAEGYHDSDGNVRVPVYANEVFRSTTTDDCSPITLALTTKAFDKKNPNKSITLMQCKNASQNVWGTPYPNQLSELFKNVVFVDSAKNPGTVTFSEDGKSLIYTAPAPMGLLISVR